jgi:hypothetical protein
MSSTSKQGGWQNCFQPDPLLQGIHFAVGLAIGPRDAELLDEEVLKIILPHLDFRLMDNAFRPT